MEGRQREKWDYLPRLAPHSHLATSSSPLPICCHQVAAGQPHKVNSPQGELATSKQRESQTGGGGGGKQAGGQNTELYSLIKANLTKASLFALHPASTGDIPGLFLIFF